MLFDFCQQRLSSISGFLSWESFLCQSKDVTFFMKNDLSELILETYTSSHQEYCFVMSDNIVLLGFFALPHGNVLQINYMYIERIVGEGAWKIVSWKKMITKNKYVFEKRYFNLAYQGFSMALKLLISFSISNQIQFQCIFPSDEKKSQAIFLFLLKKDPLDIWELFFWMSVWVAKS